MKTNKRRVGRSWDRRPAFFVGLTTITRSVMSTMDTVDITLRVMLLSPAEVVDEVHRLRVAGTGGVGGGVADEVACLQFRVAEQDVAVPAQVEVDGEVEFLADGAAGVPLGCYALDRAAGAVEGVG